MASSSTKRELWGHQHSQHTEYFYICVCSENRTCQIGHRELPNTMKTKTLQWALGSGVWPFPPGNAALKDVCSHIWQNSSQQWPCSLNSPILKNLWCNQGGVNLNRVVHKIKTIPHSTDKQIVFLSSDQRQNYTGVCSQKQQSIALEPCYSPVLRCSSVTLW